MDIQLLRRFFFLSRNVAYVLVAQLIFAPVSLVHARDAKGMDTAEFQNSAVASSRSVLGELSQDAKLSVTPLKSESKNTQKESLNLSTVSEQLASKNKFEFNANAPKKSSGTENLPENADAALAQITGTVTDGKDGLPIPGVTVLVKGTTRGVATDIQGQFRLNAEPGEVLIFTYIGFKSQEIQVSASRTAYNVVLNEDETSMDEVVIIGYGEQRRETLIGAVSQTNSQTLQRTGGVSNLGAALTGNLPGLITTSSSGMPGDETPQIFIRGQNSWNGNSPLILVDGVERPEFFNQMDVGSVESISVLKDASATAVFGSRGANGVIIVTTKRGKEGKAEILVRVNATVKAPSKLPGKMDAYDAIGIRNQAIERELSVSPQAWSQMIPEGIREKYRNPANLEESERYPNIDWQEYLFKDYAMAYNANVSITGGTKLTKYFTSFDFQNEGDLFKQIENDRGYSPGYNFNRLNFRNNLDFQLTSTTNLKINMGGIYGVRKTPWQGGDDANFWRAAYRNPPDAFVPRYDNGLWGYYPLDDYGAINSARVLAIGGIENITTTSLSTNLVLEQDLKMIVKGLNFRGTIAVDNTFTEVGRGVNDLFNNTEQMWIDPVTGRVNFKNNFDNSNFDFFQPIAWTTQGGTFDQGQRGTQRRLFYQLQLNYNTTIADDHNLNLMGLFSRQEDAIGNIIPSYREDWVFRTVYDYKRKYLVEYNGAYNGSEKFGIDYRFAFFSSGGLGWVISEENFMKRISAVDFLKVTASYGQVGDDNIGSRFLYMNQWAFGGSSRLANIGWRGDNSQYTWYREQVIGNPSVRWETVYKYNFKTEFSLFDGLLDGSFDVFKDDRVDILMAGDRSIPSYFGANAPAANLGRVTTTGYEIQLGFNKILRNGIRVWADLAVTRAVDVVINRDDPEFLVDYQKQAGFQLGQYRSHLDQGYYNSWDELYASTTHNTNNGSKLPGGYHISDFNGDGVIDAFDSAPYGFSGVPQNTFNSNIGMEWRGLSFFVQLYGVNNVTRDVPFTNLDGQRNLVYEEGTYWSKDNPNADTPLPSWLTPTSYYYGTRYLYDGSYLRLKNAEIAYTLRPEKASKLGLGGLRMFLNGNNLLVWSKMPDDRESNFGVGASFEGGYPMVRRINLGLTMTF
ncbi:MULTISPECIES: SusC/RagA family TonB-linked outer membrane protein [Rhodonellum]|uniref:TonB-linked outer membrane protein, SusC/RagA family n=1 Tax=Rhodonellum ikkaensis TaxID=336829 RepID=A0A1H3K9W4_9BACT|nr:MULTISPECIES: TonB-dependent receptor [Rhodonellum]SDY48951.1 TonB-linked outer membrane protein, SusC/RagA family [Rhodonellum ikkaensis]